MPGPRETIAHAATPWEWRSRRSVVVLVIAMSFVTLAAVLDGWLNERMNPLVATIMWGTIGTLLLVWPAVRSLRRWDQVHSSPVP